MADPYDAIVVGGGPGGASAAYFLGEAGRRVLVLDKHRLPRYKACGGGLSIHMLSSYFPFFFEPVIEARVGAVAFATGDGRIRMPLADDSVCTVMRDRFDEFILEHARAEVRQGLTVDRVREYEDRVVVETKEGPVFEGRHLIGADGANSAVARSLGIREGKTTSAAIEAEVPAPPEVMRHFADALWFIFGKVRMDYLWVFPKKAHLSIGIGALRPGRGELQTTLRRVMARLGLSLDGVPLHGHPIPLYVRRERISTSRSLLVGDAAGLADPLTGEGIRLAIKSGRLAAQAILSGSLHRYPALVHQQIGRSHSLGLTLAWLFYHFPRFCLLFGAPNPFVTSAFAEMLADRAGYPEAVCRSSEACPPFWRLKGRHRWRALLPGRIASTVSGGQSTPSVLATN